MSATTADAPQVFVAVGRRKEASARVRLTSGTGKVTVNDKDLEAYFPSEQLATTAAKPLSTVELKDEVDVVVRVAGGGHAGQAGAVSLGIARALEKMDGELRAQLKPAGFMTRDPRMRERKKSGQPGARKRFQFSKR